MVLASSDPHTSGYGGFIGRTAIMAIVGGTASALGGGKFANGAVSGAFVHMFNAEGNTLYSLVRHYFGDGSPLTVSDDYILSKPVQDKMRLFENEVLQKAKINGGYTGYSKVSTNVTTESAYLFAIGHTGNDIGLGYNGLYMTANCLDGSCFFTYDMLDSFRDPLDIGIGLPYSKPYLLFGHWEKEVAY